MIDWKALIGKRLLLRLATSDALHEATPVEVVGDGAFVRLSMPGNAHGSWHERMRWSVVSELPSLAVPHPVKDY